MSNLEHFIAALTQAYERLYVSDPDTYGIAKARYTPAEWTRSGRTKRDLAAYLVKHGIRCCQVAPGNF